MLNAPLCLSVLAIAAATLTPSPTSTSSGTTALAALGPASAVANPDAALARIDEEALAIQVRELVALGPRMGGTESGDRAAILRAKRFLEAGLDVNVYSDPAKWAHTEHSFRVVAHGPDGQRITLERAWPYGYSPSASGRVPLGLEAGAGQAVLRTRLPRFGGGGSSAVTLVDGATTADGTWPKVHHLRRGMNDDAPVFGISADEGATLRAGLANGEAWEVEYELDATIAKGQPKTVEARIAPRAGAEPGFLLYCAHGDSDAGGPGANDNGSGEAIVLAIAQAWQGAIDAGELAPPEREVRFAIWGSEIYSTQVYLDDVLARGERILGVINYDQAGFGSGAEQLNIEPDDLPANEALVRTLVDELAVRDGADGFPARWATNKSLGGTDSYVFSSSKWFRENGVPAVTVFTSAWDKPEEHPRTDGMPGESWSDRDVVTVDYDNYYHSAGDTPENTTDKEPWNMGWCARVGLAGGLRWLDVLSSASPVDGR